VIRALLLDLDNTLVDRDAALLAWLDDALPAHARRPEHVEALVACDRGGRGPRAAFFARFAALAHLPAASVRRRFLRDFPRCARLKPDADALLRGFPGPTVIVTNGPASLQRGKLAAAGLADRVAHVVVSGELGVRKPDAAIFRAALAHAGCGAEHALMIGDDPDTDVAGARAAGIPAVLVRTRWFDAPAAMPSVHDLTEIAW